jgi:hypothetical protein
MRFERFILISLLILFCSKAYTQTRKYAGSYFYGDTIPQGAIDIYPESDTTLLFSIYLINSNYHMGFNMGRIHIRKDSAIFENINPNHYNCRLYFEFKMNALTVKTIGEHNDCGYGYGVMSDGVYHRTNDKIPEYTLTPESDTVYFKKYSLEK